MRVVMAAEHTKDANIVLVEYVPCKLRKAPREPVYQENALPVI